MSDNISSYHISNLPLTMSLMGWARSFVPSFLIWMKIREFFPSSTLITYLFVRNKILNKYNGHFFCDIFRNRDFYGFSFLITAHAISIQRFYNTTFRKSKRLLSYTNIICVLNCTGKYIEFSCFLMVWVVKSSSTYKLNHLVLL